MFTTSMLKVGKKETIICETNSYTFKYLKFTFQTAKKSKAQFKCLEMHWNNIIISI